MTSPELQAILAAVPAGFADPAADYRAVRATMAPFHNQPVSDATDVDMLELGGVPCGRYRRRGCGTGPGYLLHVHGGAFVSCPLAVYHFYGEMILSALERTVILPDYRLAPEHPWPAAGDDCLAAYRGLLETGVEPGEVVVLGESCGGGLALGALLRARDEGLPMPAGFVSLTGWFDLSMRGAVDGPDPFLSVDWVRNRGRDYTAGAVALDDPRVSPALAAPEALAGLPPLYLQVGQYDTVAPGALELARRATLAGVAVEMLGWPGMPQGWHGLLNAGVPEARAAWRDIRAFVDRRLPAHL
jgi:acetyl esterase/lipase